jgi:hypothetical protein
VPSESVKAIPLIKAMFVHRLASTSSILATPQLWKIELLSLLSVLSYRALWIKDNLHNTSSFSNLPLILQEACPKENKKKPQTT